MSIKSETIVNYLPSEFYPNCWNDDERMDNLFAPFRSKSVNVVNYEKKLEFWRNLIKKYCEHDGNAIITINQLKQKFQRGDKKPYCLDVVIREQLTNGTVKPKSLFTLKAQETWSGWAVNTFIKSPLQWSFNKVKERVVSPVDSFEDTEFVVVDVIEVSDICLMTFESSETKVLCQNYITMPSHKSETILCRFCSSSTFAFSFSFVPTESEFIFLISFAGTIQQNFKMFQRVKRNAIGCLRIGFMQSIDR